MFQIEKHGPSFNNLNLGYYGIPCFRLLKMPLGKTQQGTLPRTGESLRTCTFNPYRSLPSSARTFYIYPAQEVILAVVPSSQPLPGGTDLFYGILAVHWCRARETVALLIVSCRCIRFDSVPYIVGSKLTNSHSFDSWYEMSILQVICCVYLRANSSTHLLLRYG